jgi:hypothetical protein
MVTPIEHKCIDCSTNLPDNSDSERCRSCDWKQRVSNEVTVELVDLDPDGIRRKAAELAERKSRGWLPSSAPRVDFNRRLLASNCWACESDQTLQLDHWDNDRSNGSEGNARTLCTPCHDTKSDFFRQDREPSNKRFLDWVTSERMDSRDEGFRHRQESRFKHQIYETVCSKRGIPHKHSYCEHEIVMLSGYCKFCPHMSSLLQKISEPMIRRGRRCYGVAL